MERYRITIKPSAIGELDGVRRKRDRQRIVSRISRLADSPRPGGCEKLSGRTALYRIRQGDFRIVHKIDDADQLIRIIKIGQRKDVYR